MTKLNTITVTGLSGKVYLFDVYPIGTEFKPIGAVYFFSKAQISPDIVYIGQTGDLSERFENHHKWFCIIRNKAKYICIHLDSNENSRLSKEKDLISRYKPICNG